MIKVANSKWLRECRLKEGVECKRKECNHRGRHEERWDCMIKCETTKEGCQFVKEEK